MSFPLTSTVMTLPAHLRRSLTWDQGKEMAQHQQFSLNAPRNWQLILESDS